LYSYLISHTRSWKGDNTQLTSTRNLFHGNSSSRHVYSERYWGVSRYWSRKHHLFRVDSLSMVNRILVIQHIARQLNLSNNSDNITYPVARQIILHYKTTEPRLQIWKLNGKWLSSTHTFLIGSLMNLSLEIDGRDKCCTGYMYFNVLHTYSGICWACIII